MPAKKNHPESSDRPKKNRILRNSLKEKSNSNNTKLKLVCFENSVASKAREEDIIRACSVYNKTQKKIINLKIAQIYFN